MKSSKLNLALIFGGKSAEHDISIRSANNIIQHIDQSKYNIILIGIDRSGNWFLNEKSDRYKDLKEALSLKGFNQEVMLCLDGSSRLYNIILQSYIKIDIAHPVLHGPFGEDGAIQGLLKTAEIPFVGADVLGSSVGMDKEIMKRILRDAGIPIGPFMTCYKEEEPPTFTEVSTILSMPVFVKPANMGSSIGINKVYNEQQFVAALADAFQYDRKIIIEANIKGREIECAVLGNESPLASTIGEIVLTDDFYAYDTKYIDDDGAITQIPAQVGEDIMERTRNMAIKTFKVLGCEGLGRVDFFLQKDGKILVNEINTIPGFTSISMYPSLWKASGLSYEKLIAELYDLALERYERDQKLK